MGNQILIKTRRKEHNEEISRIYTTEIGTCKSLRPWQMELEEVFGEFEHDILTITQKLKERTLKTEKS